MCVCCTHKCTRFNIYITNDNHGYVRRTVSTVYTYKSKTIRSTFSLTISCTAAETGKSWNPQKMLMKIS